MTGLRSNLRAAKRLVRLAVHRASGTRLPFSVTFILTHRCNFQCDYCDIPSKAGAEMTTREFQRAIDELEGVGMARASFSGGEALLRRDAVEIIAHAKSRGLMTSLNSNAWLLEKRLPELDGVLDMLVLSLDGPETVHDLVRRQKGSYARVIRIIEEARRRNIAVATITVLSGPNLGVVDEVLRIADQMGFWAYFQPAYESCFDTKEGLDAALVPIVFGDLATRLRDAKSLGRPVGASATYLKRLANGPDFGDCATCHAGHYFGTVMPDGTMVPCHLRSTDAPRRSGLDLGFARAWAELDTPHAGPGCAISPYQESDLIFGLDRGAVLDAIRRARGREPQRG